MKQLALAVGCAALAAMAIAADVRAQEPFPTRPVQVIVPATAGGPVDTAVRMIAPALETALGQSVVLLNRPGASGTVGMHDVATAEPNGYTIGQGVNSIFTITRISGTTVPFTLDDFSLLGNYATDVSVLAVSADAPWRTLDDIIDYVHSNPGKLNYASAGVGTVSSLSMQALAHNFKLTMVAVPFQGGAQLTTAILGRQVDIGMVPYTTGAAMFEAGKLRALVTTAPKRLPKLPDVPTLGGKGHYRERPQSHHGPLRAARIAGRDTGHIGRCRRQSGEGPCVRCQDRSDRTLRPIRGSGEGAQPSGVRILGHRRA